ncbi:fanconi-associated nuclease 1-like [Epargyreus clarus]|uniref:fanconi-associated nuclease 1-like n=1 Tax=Epargyreus clarus TaxID=520877 RepID=UPI003C301E67
MSGSLSDYFKTSKKMQDTKKRKLSLIKPKTPPKGSKSSPESTQENVINLSSDDEESSSPNKKPNGSSSTQSNKTPDQVQDIDDCNSTASTIIYTPGTPRKSHTPVSKSSSSASQSGSKTPGSRDKFYSPVKQKNLKLRSTKVKKNLCNMLDGKKDEDQVFLEASAGMDDKTVFLLKIISKYLNDSELRPLLIPKSEELLSKCMVARKPGTRLICRLYWRKEGWYRVDAVKQISTEKKYEIDDQSIQDMINNLIENGLIESANCQGSQCEMKLEECLDVLKVNELKEVCKDFKVKVNNKKDAMERLKSYSLQKSNISTYFIGSKTDNASRVFKSVCAKAGPCYRLTEAMRKTLDELYLLMYLGIDYNIIRTKKLELTLIYDKIKRECYPVDKDMPIDNASIVFKTRDEFERYVQASNIYEDFLETTKLEDKCRIVENVYNLYKGIDQTTMLSYRSLAPWLQRFTPPNLYVKILESGIQELKKSKTKERIGLARSILSDLIAQNTFRQHRKAEWYAEKALILDKFMLNPDEAAQVLLEGFKTSMSEEAKDCMRPRANKLACRLTNCISSDLQDELLQYATKDTILEKNLKAHHVFKVPLESYNNRGKIKFETRTAEGRVVQEAEEFCISYYMAEQGYTHGWHWEGKIVTTLFFLLFWDIIYASLRGVRGVYLTHYQVYPLDMFLDSFYTNRKVLIEERLKEIEQSSTEDIVQRVCDTWESRPETELSGISRDVGLESVCAVCRALGGARAAALCARLAADCHARSGFPDLTLYNAHTDEIKFVEVKTDSDKPSMKQIQWMHYLQENGINTEFCYVGVNTKRCKARNS